MSNKCPTCNRELREIFDYPLIYIHDIYIIGIPQGLELPYSPIDIFISPNIKALNEHAPKKVYEFFDKNPNEAIFNYDGWNWTKLIGQEKYGLSKEGYFIKSDPNQRDLIIKEIDSYLNTLKNFIGKEITLTELYPPFEKNSFFYFGFNIPQTGYILELFEHDLDHSFIREASLNVKSSAGDYILKSGESFKQSLEVAVIKYEGKLNNQ